MLESKITTRILLPIPSGVIVLSLRGERYAYRHTCDGIITPTTALVPSSACRESLSFLMCVIAAASSLHRKPSPPRPPHRLYRVAVLSYSRDFEGTSRTAPSSTLMPRISLTASRPSARTTSSACECISVLQHPIDTSASNTRHRHSRAVIGF